MPAPQPATTGAPTDSFDANSFDTGHAHNILRGLMEAGAELVQCLVEQARKDPVPHPYWGDKAPVDHPTEHIARCYDRITRSVRRTIALARQLDQPLRCQPAHPSVEPRAPKAARAVANDTPERPEQPERPDTPDWNENHTQDLDRPLDTVIAELQADLPPLPQGEGWGEDQAASVPPLPLEEGRGEGQARSPTPTSKQPPAYSPGPPPDLSRKPTG